LLLLWNGVSLLQSELDFYACFLRAFIRRKHLSSEKEEYNVQ
jgi:hypothetical protein